MATTEEVRSSQVDTSTSETDSIYMARAREIAARAKEMGLNDHDKELLASENKEEQARVVRDSLKQQFVPNRILETVDGKLSATPAMKAASDFLKAPKDGWCLVLAGPKGCGKSTAAGWYLAQKTKSQVSCPPKTRRWWTAARLVRVSGVNNEFEPLIQVPTMVIDDLGLEYMDKNGHFNSRLDEIIDERYSNYRPTVITTNLNAQAFKERYGARVIDRIREGFRHGGAFIEINHGSLRG